MKNDDKGEVPAVAAVDTGVLALTLSTGGGLLAESLENRLTGTTIPLRGPARDAASCPAGDEFDVQIDGGAERITIGGWRGTSFVGAVDERRYPMPEFDDSSWNGFASPIDQFPGIHSTERPERLTVWRRTHLPIPRSWEGQEVHLVIGGWRLFDYSETIVYLNGVEVGCRRVSSKWHEPGDLVLPADEIRFGQDNLLSLRLKGQIAQTEELDAFDPSGTRALTWQLTWPAQMEQYLYVGVLSVTPSFSVSDVRCGSTEDQESCEVDLAADDMDLAATMRYWWKPGGPVIHKQLSLRNTGARNLRVLRIGMGDYCTTLSTSNGEQGFPVHVGDELYVGLAHPSGWAKGGDGTVELVHFPGRVLPPGETLTSMEAVYGAAPAGRSREAFRSHLRGRMRRVATGHDRAYSVYDAFGSWDLSSPDAMLGDQISESMVLETADWLQAAKEEAGVHFDFDSIDFWVDAAGDTEQPDPARFPRGFRSVFKRLQELDISPGLWLDSSMGHWSIGDNPAIFHCVTHDPAYRNPKVPCVICRATETAHSFYLEGYRKHLDAGVRLVKFDNLLAWCTNPGHEHLPGVYSTEAIHNSVIDFLVDLDQRCPELFIMLYWGYRSPWWLLYGDTIFESGLLIEASSPAPEPTFYARSGVISGLDAVRDWSPDVPPLGRDSLGVWLSDWGWNSSIGTGQWQDAFVMDMARGNLLGQIWSDFGLLPGEGRHDLARFLELLREHQEQFANSRLILGDPRRPGPYAYLCCANGHAFVAIHNAGWDDAALAFSIAEDLGLHGEEWAVFRHYPDPAPLVSFDESPFRDRIELSLRPFRVMLLHVASPQDLLPTDSEGTPTEVLAAHFRRASREIELMRSACKGPLDSPGEKIFECDVNGLAPGCLVVSAEAKDHTGAACLTNHPQRDFQVHLSCGDAELTSEPVLGKWTYPVGWQAWRVPELPSSGPPIRITVESTCEGLAELHCAARIIPDEY